MKHTTQRICPLCEACCGLTLEFEDAQLTKVRGNPDDVFSRGFLCPKAVALGDLQADPDRLRTPLIKRGERFEEASWDEAFAEIETRLLAVKQAYGADAIGTVLGNPVAHKMGVQLAFPRLARALGTRNMFSASSVDQVPKMLACGLMYGAWLSVPVPDITRTDLLIVVGANPMVSNGSLWTVPDFRGKAKALRARGGKLVVIDPRRSETAAIADSHHFIRPGADVFFLLAFAQVLFAEGRVDLKALAAHVNGLDALRAAVAPYPPERVAARCGMSADAIRALAHAFADAPRAALYGRIGTCTQEFGSLASWLLDAINILCGRLDAEGGLMFPKAPAFAANTRGKPGTGRGAQPGRYHSRVSHMPEVAGELPLTCLAEEIETPGPGQVRALITMAANPVLSAPNGARLAQAFDELDFMLSLDLYLNETTRHADIILPGLPPLEDSHFDVAFNHFACHNVARYSPAALAPSQPSEWDCVLRLTAIALGLGANADLAALETRLLRDEVERQAGPLADALLAATAHLRGPERMLDMNLRSGPYGDQFGQRPDGLNLAQLLTAPNGIDCGPLAPRIPECLRTPSGKIELAPPLFVADLARVETALSAPPPELVIIGRRQLRSNNSWMHNLPVLAKGPFRCTALLHPNDGALYGLTHGSMARIEGPKGSVLAQVELSDEMMPGVLSLPHGWGHDLPGTRMSLAMQRPGANVNALLDENLRDPLSGNAVLSGVPVSIAPAE